jgi:hypothetical protein
MGSGLINWFMNSKVNKGGIHRQHGNLISLLLFFQNKETMLKILNSNQHPWYLFVIKIVSQKYMATFCITLLDWELN